MAGPRDLSRTDGTASPRQALAVLAALLLGGTAAAQAGPEPARGVAFTQRLGGRVPLDARFTDAAGRSVALGDCVSGRPAVLALVYYECPMLCTQVLNGLVRCLRPLSLDAGRDFDVVVLSFDPGEGTDLAAAKKSAYVDSYGRAGAAAGFRFLTGAEDEIRRLTEAVGFRYRYDPGTDLYAHASGIVVLTADGTIARYFYGVEYPARDVRLGLVEASDGRVGDLADELLLLCLQYDPATGRYGFAIVSALRIGGVLTIVVLAGYVLLTLRRERRRRGPPAGAAPPEDGR